MKAVNDTWRQLVSRRLLPVVIVLAAALVAVPLVLAKDPEPAEPAALAPVDESAATATKTIVSVATPEGRKRKVLGSPTNPFRGEPVPEPETTTTQSSAPSTSSPSSASGAGAAPDVASAPSSGGGSAPSVGLPPSVGTAPATPATPAAKHYAKDELTVRFGGTEGSPKRRSLERLEPLPPDEHPVLIYLGVRADGKTAVFLVDHGVNAIGDGSCRPSPEQCDTLELREGETEFLDVTDATGKVTAQYELDLLEIHNGTPASTARAKAARRLLKTES